VRALARRLEELRRGIPERDAVDEVPPVSAERAQDAFDLRDGALNALHGSDRPFAVVRIETQANIAIGVAPWGPFAQAAADPQAEDSRRWAAHAQHVVSETDASGGAGEALQGVLEGILSDVPDGHAVVVIGKAVHRYPFARRVVDVLRAQRPTLVVDMGWPSDDRAYADVATFGASRLVGRSLMALLESAAPSRDRSASGAGR
jgi:beta-N-acetylhexosaminidase